MRKNNYFLQCDKIACGVLHENRIFVIQSPSSRVYLILPTASNLDKIASFCH